MHANLHKLSLMNIRPVNSPIILCANNYPPFSVYLSHKDLIFGNARVVDVQPGLVFVDLDGKPDGLTALKYA